MKKNGVLVFVFTFVLIFISFSFSHHYKELSHNIFGKVTSGIYTAKENIYTFLKKSEITKENDRLKTELSEKNSYKEENKFLRKENENLRELLKIRNESPSSDKTAAEVIGISRSSDFTITVNRGKNHGIKKDNIAVFGNMLVGKVSEVFSDFSFVTPITAPDTTVGIVTGNEDVGMISGANALYRKNMCELSFFSNTAKFAQNETVYTSGMSDIYPRGMVIGKIKSKDGKAYVKTEVDFFKIRTLDLISTG